MDPYDWDRAWGLSTEAGEFRIWGSGTLYVAQLDIAGDEFSGAVTRYAPGAAGSQTVTSGSIRGNIIDNAVATGHMSFAGEPDLGFSLGYDPSHERDSSLALLGGTWREQWAEGGRWPGGPLDVYTVDALGAVFAQDSAGCVYSGQVAQIDSAFNTYRITIEVSNCGASDGSYEGLAALIDFVDGLNIFALLSSTEAGTFLNLYEF